MLGGSRRRLDGIGLGYLSLDASYFQYHAGTAAKLVLADWASTPAASLCSSAWTPRRPSPGTPGAGFWPASAGAPGLPLLVISGGRPG